MNLDEVIKEHSGLVYYIINMKFKWAQKFVLCEYEDLLQEGFIALMNANRLFDPDRNIKFSTYACSAIYQQLRQYVSTHISILTTPTDFFYHKRNKGRHGKVAVRGGRFSELFRETNNISWKLDRMIKELGIEDRRSLDDQEEWDLVQKIIGRKLNDREKYILEKRSEGQTLEKIGYKYGITKERIRQVEYRALQKIREEVEDCI